MRSFLNPLFALMLAAALAACSSTPTEDDSSATDDMSQQTLSGNSGRAVYSVQAGHQQHSADS